MIGTNTPFWISETEQCLRCIDLKTRIKGATRNASANCTNQTVTLANWWWLCEEFDGIHWMFKY